MRPPECDIPLPIDLLDEAFGQKSWHGPNLCGSVRVVTAGQAAWRPRRALAAGLLMMLAAAGASPASDLSPLARDMLAAHNAVREHVGLRPFVWSDRLAAVAQSWADTLLKRGQFYHRPQSRYGENLLEIRSGSAMPENVVHDWNSESLEYDHLSNRCRSVCGHYTQIVWRSTVEVGCAVARGGGREVWVCEYNPPGNAAGKKPY